MYLFFLENVVKNNTTFYKDVFFLVTGSLYMHAFCEKKEIVFLIKNFEKY